MFDNIRLPVEIEQGAKGGPLFQTSIVELSSGNEQRNEDWTYPRQAWDIGYGVQNQDDYSACRDFFYARHGRSHGFLFKDWSDFSATDQSIGTGDGTTRTFFLIKTYEPGDYMFTRRITRVVNDTLYIKVNGVAQVPTTDFVVGSGGWIRFTTAPVSSATITATFEFDIPMRFNVDVFPLVLDWVGAGTIPTLPVIEIRDDSNEAPTGIHLINLTSSISEITDVTTHLKVADITVDDDPFGQDMLAVTGTDAASFEIVGTLDQLNRTGAALYLKAGVFLNYLLKSSYAVTVTVDDPTVGTHPAASANFTLGLTQINSAPSITLINTTTFLAEGTITTGLINMADIVVTDDNLGLRAVTLTGADAALFTLSGSLSAGSIDPVTGRIPYTGMSLQTVIGFDTSSSRSFLVNVVVADSGLPSPPQGVAAFALSIGVVPGLMIVTIADTVATMYGFTTPFYSTLVVELWGPGAGGNGTNVNGTNGTGDTTITCLGLVAGRGLAPVVGSNVGGLGGIATGGDTNLPGGPGNAGITYSASLLSRALAPWEPPSIQFSAVAGGAAGDGNGAGVAVLGDSYVMNVPGYYYALGAWNAGQIGGDVGRYVTLPPTIVNGAAATASGGAGGGSARYGTLSTPPWYIDQVATHPFASMPGNDYTIVEDVVVVPINIFGTGSPSGGGGAKLTKTYIFGVTPGAPNPGDILDVSIGMHGVGGVSFASGGDGFDGQAKFTWS